MSTNYEATCFAIGTGFSRHSHEGGNPALAFYT